MSDEVTFDWARSERTGLDEAVLASGKSVAQITAIVEQAQARHSRLFVTRLSRDQYDSLSSAIRAALDYCDVSCTARLGAAPSFARAPRVAIVAAGTSDVPVAREARRTLAYYGEDTAWFADVGVAGLWRLTSRIDAIRQHGLIIAVAGMDAALPTVLAGLVRSAIIAVPTSVGYGVAAGGHAALNAILASCSPGISTVNIDNGFGAACAAMRILHTLDHHEAERAAASGSLPEASQ
ncbi:nickel pincer cofactor biosynthesis protein LarB [Paraburkholderia sp. JPY419]|uniref:nickel pincer cofactor biosynthesis protein LarB n=1 Tax=Paraburkholderia sp. JPY419 TaxID=667660 RepID=UPI003D23FA3B